MMSRMDAKCRWMFVVKTVILLYGMFLKSITCQHCDKDASQIPQNILIVSAKELNGTFPSGPIVSNVTQTKVCFHVPGQNGTDCCQTTDFNCSFDNQDDGRIAIILNRATLHQLDVVVITEANHIFTCGSPSDFNKGGFFFNIHNCSNTGKRNIRISCYGLCGRNSFYDEKACRGLAETDYKLFIGSTKNETKCVSCELPGTKPNLTLPIESGDDGHVSPEKAAHIMTKLPSLLEQMGSSTTAAIASGDIKGILTKLRPRNHRDISCGITKSGDMRILGANTDVGKGFFRFVHIPQEASVMANKKNGSFAGVVLFPGMLQDDRNSFFFNNEAMGIEMGADISNLSNSIEIHYNNVDKNGMIPSCRSWDGKGETQNWITDGCRIKETDGAITCHCSHLTFFAILMSPAPGNISASDFKSLSYITSVGCGMSMFFLAVALFMHFLIRKGGASQATQILMNLFVAMFTLNLSFLINESIADLGNRGACVAMAAFMHYAMLATFSWFFIEALHLHLNLWKRPTEIKHYMMKICISGWAIPGIVVLILLACKTYDFMEITTDGDEGNSEKMCWIPDVDVHKGVNIGYYAVVFLFTFVVFVMTVWQIFLLKPAAKKNKNSSTIKSNSFSIVGLFLLLGITWAFAFFSYGPLLIPSYYIFTFLNSFQGFFLFIYYYNSRKNVENYDATVSSSPTITSSTATSAYK